MTQLSSQNGPGGTLCPQPPWPRNNFAIVNTDSASAPAARRLTNGSQEPTRLEWKESYRRTQRAICRSLGLAGEACGTDGPGDRAVTTAARPAAAHTALPHRRPFLWGCHGSPTVAAVASRDKTDRLRLSTSTSALEAPLQGRQAQLGGSPPPRGEQEGQSLPASTSHRAGMLASLGLKKGRPQAPRTAGGPQAALIREGQRRAWNTALLLGLCDPSWLVAGGQAPPWRPLDTEGLMGPL